MQAAAQLSSRTAKRRADGGTESLRAMTMAGIAAEMQITGWVRSATGEPCCSHLELTHRILQMCSQPRQLAAGA